MVYLLYMAYGDYGALFKKCAPRKINSASDAEQAGLRVNLPELLKKYGPNLWWQKWKGILFSVKFQKPQVIYDGISYRCGKYTRGWFSLDYEQ